jgi:hypothetical protein
MATADAHMAVTDEMTSCDVELCRPGRLAQHGMAASASLC